MISDRTTLTYNVLDVNGDDYCSDDDVGDSGDSGDDFSDGTNGTFKSQAFCSTMLG